MLCLQGGRTGAKIRANSGIDMGRSSPFTTVRWSGWPQNGRGRSVAAGLPAARSNCRCCAARHQHGSRFTPAGRSAASTSVVPIPHIRSMTPRQARSTSRSEHISIARCTSAGASSLGASETLAEGQQSFVRLRAACRRRLEAPLQRTKVSRRPAGCIPELRGCIPTATNIVDCSSRGLPSMGEGAVG